MKKTKGKKNQPPPYTYTRTKSKTKQIFFLNNKQKTYAQLTTNSHSMVSFSFFSSNHHKPPMIGEPPPTNTSRSSILHFVP